MKISIDSEEGGTVCMRVAGSVTQKEIEILADPMSDLLGADAYRRRVCLDLGNTAFLDSSGINWLILSNKRFREQGGRLVLHSLPPLVMNVIKILKMQRVFEIVDSSQSAKKLLQTNEAALPVAPGTSV